MSEAHSPTPYRSGMIAAFGHLLPATLVMWIADLVHIGGVGGFVIADLALWSLVTLPLGVGLGILLGAGNATWGDGWIVRTFRRLREDRRLDADVMAVFISVGLIALGLVLVVNTLAHKLVIDAKRQTQGALLLGVVVVVIVPVAMLGALPLFRVLRRATIYVPAIGPMSRVVLQLVGAAVAVVILGAYVITSGYDYQATALGALLALAMLPVVALVIAILGHSVLDGVRRRIPRPGTLVVGGVALAALLPWTLFITPSEATKAAIEDRAYFGSLAISNLRKLIDRDGDGFSPFFGGPDCNDSDPNINPDADDVPGDGIDQNCSGADAKVTVEDGPPDAPPPRPGVDAPPPEPPLSGGKNLVIVFVDTLRYDRLGFSGYKRNGASLTPRIDAFAAQSVVFESAYAQAPNTPRSAPSFLSSHYPSQVKYDDKKRDYPKISEDNELLFEVMKQAGFATVGESSHFYFCDRDRYPKSCDGVATWLNSNIGQGADLWDNEGAGNIPESNSDVAGPRIVKKSVAKIEELAKADKKFALLVHLFEPHSDYMTHKKYTYKDNSLAEKYDYEVALTDDFFGEILDALDKHGLAKNTTVVLMSDHGEAFGVHRFAGQQMFFHGQTLYRELLHVPLMFRVPGAAPQKRTEVVQLVDLSPTIAGLFDLAAPKSWQGRNLVPALQGKPIAARASYAELLRAHNWNHEAKSMISADGRHHVFYRISDNRWEVYDLSTDPEERQPLDNDLPLAKELRQKLLDWMEGPLRAGVLK